MFNSPATVIVAILVLAVLVILMFGIGTFARGGEFNRRNANKIMRLRIIAQALAILVIVIVAAWRGH